MPRPTGRSGYENTEHVCPMFQPLMTRMVREGHLALSCLEQMPIHTCGEPCLHLIGFKGASLAVSLLELTSDTL